MEVRKEGEKIIFKFPVSVPRSNPYMGDDEQHLLGNYPYFTGLIVRHCEGGNNYDEIGFAGTIDFDYKGKPDQVLDFIVMWGGDEKSFIDKCKELDINIQEMDFK